MKLNYKAAVDCFEKALNVLRRLQPTLAERLDILRHLSNSLLLLAQEQNKLKNWFSVIELLQRVLVERNDLQEAKQDKDDTDQIRRNLVRTYMVYCADLDDDWEYILRHKMFHNAIAHSSKILNLQPNDYKLLSNAYFKVGGIVGEFASQLLQLNSSITTEAFAKTWMQVYKASSDKNDESMSQMLKLLEIISQNYDSPNFPQSAFIECLKNPINKEKLNKKIAEAKEIIHKQKSLQAIVGNSPSLEIALTQKVLKIEQDCQRLQDENKALVKRNKDMESALKSLQNQVNTQSTRSDSTPRIFRPFNKHLIEEIQPQNAGNRGPKP
jgi:tetratricopeptide (TPR) repeat protein